MHFGGHKWRIVELPANNVEILGALIRTAKGEGDTCEKQRRMSETNKGLSTHHTKIKIEKKGGEC